jgi:predicted nucleic-acid-binding Zn-ribbon protein
MLWIKGRSMTDLITTVSSALSLAGRLREISKNIEDAEFKNLLADLSLELADAKLKISDLVSENAELKDKLRALTSAAGEICPKCNNRTFELISTKPHPLFGDMGAKEREYKCSGCGFSESKLVDP